MVVKLNQHIWKLLPVVIYAVGLIGFLIPLLRDVLIMLTPLILLLSMVYTAVWNKGTDARTLITVLTIVGLAGFFIEVIGVQTGLVFGQYEYHKGLGFKLMDTPLLIGLNWAFLTYLFGTVVQQLRLNYGFRSMLAAVLMVGYDFLLEPVAPFLNMWSWDGNQIPIQNYAAWGILALLFQFIFQKWCTNHKNGMVVVVVVCLVSFFIGLNFLIDL